ncbi:hypothetical protein K0M31_000158 [Melipona bicolor]|uniref:Uncharacterized protein n=1 Tax=Melipona bicolor TaxID=60889 RepID=A0AA40GD12_9HYME|nr:hypothetical protein K0M31_000158 [Melipona bicolor]
MPHGIKRTWRPQEREEKWLKRRVQCPLSTSGRNGRATSDVAEGTKVTVIGASNPPLMDETDLNQPQPIPSGQCEACGRCSAASGNRRGRKCQFRWRANPRGW